MNVTHAMVTAVRKKALALPQDSVTTGARSRQPFRMRNRCGEDLALTIRRSGGGKEEVRFTLEDGGDDTVDFGSLPVCLHALLLCVCVHVWRVPAKYCKTSTKYVGFFLRQNLAQIPANEEDVGAKKRV